MALLLNPREVVVGHNRKVEPRPLGGDQVRYELAHRRLLAHSGIRIQSSAAPAQASTDITRPQQADHGSVH